MIHLTAMYFNYFYQTPKYLLKGDYISYAIFLIIIVFSLPTLSIAGEYFVRKSLDLPHRITSYTNLLILIDNLSTTIITAICFCGVSVIILFRKWMKGNEILLKSEINSLKRFFELEQSNNPNIRYYIYVKGNISNIFVFPMLFMSLVQCIVADSSLVELLFNLQDETLSFICKSDNNKPLDKEALFLIRQRLELQYPDKYHIHRHLILQTVILAISVSIFFDAPDKLNLSLNRFYGWFSYYLFLNMLVYVNVYILFHRFLAKNKVIGYVISVILFTVFSMFVMTILQNLFYDIAVSHQQPSGMAIFLSITSSICTIFLFLGGISTLMLFKQWITDKQNISNLQVITFRSELGFLKSQINPHFLFNMINNANIMVDEDPKMTSHILKKLDDMLQYQFNNSTRDKASLKADIAFLTDFLDLEKVRRDHFEHAITVEGNIEDIEVPPLLFIPFVENAVKHNMGTNHSYVQIKYRMKNNRLLFECKNSKPLKPVKRGIGGLGLMNIKRRLALLFENNYTLDIVETETTYTVNLELTL